MTLRADVREALDEVVPIEPPPGLTQRVVRTATTDGGQRRKEKRAVLLRAPLSLVTAFAIIVLIAGLLVGGRLIQDRQALHGARPSQLTLAQLEAIPVNLPVLTAGETCPDNPGSNSLGYDYGNGPVYVNGKLLPEISSSEGSLYSLTYYSDPNQTGLVLVRGRDLVNDGPIRFIAPTGPGYPSDSPPWPLKDELVLDTGHPPSRTPAGYGIWHVALEIDRGWSGCWGFQINGSNFSETLTGFIRPY